MIPRDFKIGPFVAPLLHFCYSCFLLADSHKYYEILVVASAAAAAAVVVVVAEFFLKLSTTFQQSI
jgi:hypothetical protein